MRTVPNRLSGATISLMICWNNGCRCEKFSCFTGCNWRAWSCNILTSRSGLELINSCKYDKEKLSAD